MKVIEIRILVVAAVCWFVDMIYANNFFSNGVIRLHEGRIFLLLLPPALLPAQYSTHHDWGERSQK
jgi:hypothetical protein